MPQSNLLPEPVALNLQQSTDRLTQARLAGLEHVLIVLPKRQAASVWRDLPYGSLIKKLLRRQSGGKGAPALSARLPNTAQTGVSLALIAPDASTFERLTVSRKLVRDAQSGNPASVGLIVLGFDDPGPAMEALVAAIWAAAFQLPSFKSRPAPAGRLRTVKVLGHGRRMDFSRVLAEAEGNNLARWLTALPPNELTPGSYRKRVETLTAEHGWDMEFLDEKALKKRGAGAFLAVCQGSPARDAGIVYLRRKAGRKARPPVLSLVGKGVCFDTGGTNLKPFKSMLDMHEDMQGSAVALGTLVALSRLNVDFDVECWLALTENRIGASAYKSQDVVAAANGTTIQVIHTDAEGRMALADTLVMASGRKPGAIVDFATLTGACVTALTNRYSGVFSNRPEWYPALESAGAEAGERVWPFPMDADFDSALESGVADIVQCPMENGGDHIYAARFLSRFVEDSVPWVHVDLAAGHAKGGLGHIPTAVTGFGVRYAVHLGVNLRIHERPAE